MKYIVIAGKNNIAVNVLSHCLSSFDSSTILCIPNRNDTGQDSWQKSLKKFCLEHHVPIISLQEAYTLTDMTFLSLEFDQIIRPECFMSTTLFNIHFSLLPKYRGCYTSIFPILYGESETGVTLHCIDAGIDTGKIIAQTHIPISNSTTAIDLYHNYLIAGTSLVFEHLPNLLNMNYTCWPQSDSAATYFARNSIDFTTLNLDVDQYAINIDRQIRAFYFPAYQVLSWNGTPYVRCKILKECSKTLPGTVLENTATYTKISTKDYNCILFKQ